MQNEKYIGDALLQKTYIEDYISKRVRKNRCELRQVYVKDNHAAIIPRDIFNRVQEECARRTAKRKVSDKATKSKYSSKFALTERLVCGECGAHYRRVTWARNDTKRIMSRCINRLENGTKYCKESPTLEEDRLHEVILAEMNNLIQNKDTIIANMQEALQFATAPKGAIDRLAAERRIADLDSLMNDLIELIGKSDSDADLFDDKFSAIADEKAAFEAQLAGDKEQQTATSSAGSRLVELTEILNDLPAALYEYDDELVRKIVDTVTVEGERVRVRFRVGI